MKTSGIKGKLFILFEWITRLAYVNLLWLGFTLLGVFFFGIFPATSAMFSLVRRWVRKDDDFSVLPLFWETYKADFKRTNGFGWIMLVLGVILYLDYMYFASSNSTLFFLLKSFTIMLVFVYALILMMIFPVFAHYKISILHLFRNAVFISMLHPLKSVIALLGSGAIGLIMVLLPTLIPFFGGSLIALYLTWITQHMFLKIDRRMQESNEA
ncbi:YesL family protein [Pseudalkalibacillus sp. Hm43]|uniref:YesL family protein n=1 Tax=Pseudalkalibacillus sp. Hm43 TaxID=3450742 RepID=UPI003F435EE4